MKRVLSELQCDYHDGNGHALIQAVRWCLRAAEPAPEWVVRAVADAESAWINGDTREFAEPWGLTRPKGWRQATRRRAMASCPEHSFLSLRTAVLRRVAELNDEGVPLLADEYGGVFPRIAEEFGRQGVSSSLARKWWYDEDNPLKNRDSQNPPNT